MTSNKVVGRTKAFAMMYNSYGCELGAFELDEVAKLFERGEVEPGDKFVVCEPGEDE